MKRKKFRVSQLFTLLLVAAFVVVTGACEDDLGGTSSDIQDEGETVKNYLSGEDAISWGQLITPLTLGLTPGNDTTEIRLNWYSSGSPADKTAQVRFIRGTRTEGTELIEKTGEVAQASTGYSAHKVTVTGLTPGASYQYFISTDGTDWSPAYDFTAPAAGGVFKFAIIADPQLTEGTVDVNSRYPSTSTTTAAGWIETMQKIAEANVSFIVSCGDQVDRSAGLEAEYTNFFAPTALRNLPLAPTSGNHDNHLHYNHHFNWPNTQVFGTETVETVAGRNYFYRYNNILFVVLNTAPYPGSASAAMPYVQNFDATLTAAKAAHPVYDWLIVQHHKSTASVGDHVADTDIQYYVEAGFERVMSEHNVDFVLAGHDHVYARSYPLAGRDDGKVSVPDKSFSAVSGSTWASPNDPVYLTFTTGSGLKYYAVSSDDTFNYANTLYVKDNLAYPYLGEVTNANGDSSTNFGSSAYMNDGFLPVSNAAYVQPYIPSYAIVEVNGKTITFSTYPIATVSGTSPGAAAPHSFNANTPYDTITVTK
ncbi:MAG: metallophosphoesterase family protein [Treponema sp.]|nr:metallophosphoesterase family protein [Treponema sp.]